MECGTQHGCRRCPGKPEPLIAGLRRMFSGAVRCDTLRFRTNAEWWENAP